MKTLLKKYGVVPGGFDIIFDDGPHTVKSQKECIEYYLPMLNNNGTMFIEDIQSVDDFDELQNTFDEVKGTLPEIIHVKELI